MAYKIKNSEGDKIDTNNVSIPKFILKNEGRMAGTVNTNSGTINIEGQQASFYAASLPTIVSNVANPVAYITPPPGRITYIESLEFMATSDCFVQLYIYKYAVTLGGSSGKIILDGMQESKCRWIKDATGGTVTWNFPDGLILMPGEKVTVLYWKSGTVGVNWMFSKTAYDLTADTNYSADKTMLVLGDSIGASGEDNALLSNLWPEAIKNKFKKAGKDIRLVNICQGGTNTDQWDWWVKQGRIDSIKADILFITLGMNDANSATGITTGYTKNGLKNIVNRYLLINPKGKVVINNIPPTDKTSVQTEIANYRIEIATTCAEMVTAGLPVYIVDLSAAYSTSTGAAYLPTEQTAGTRLHPNSTVGQAAITNIVWEVCKNLLS